LSLNKLLLCPANPPSLKLQRGKPKTMADELDKKEEQKPAEQASAQDSQPTAASEQPVESDLQKCQRERDEYLAGWQRAKADFLNYQKDERKRLEEFLKFCESGLISDLLPVLDSFDLALRQAQGEAASARGDNQLKGFWLIKSQLDDILKKRGLEPIKSLGEKFNPELHEAVASVDSTPSTGSGQASQSADTIIEEIQKGYLLNGRVLRPSKVKIIK